MILVTHNPNLAVGADAEQVLYVTLDKAAGYKFTYESGSIENPRINDAIVKILEGSKPAFVQRALRTRLNSSPLESCCRGRVRRLRSLRYPKRFAVTASGADDVLC